MSDLKRYQMYIDGQWVDAKNGKTFESSNPATCESWAIIPEAGAADVDRAVHAAHQAFAVGPWSTMLPTQRGKLLRRLGDLLAEHSETLGLTETTDTGKLLKETRWQATYIADYFHYYAGLADKVQGATLPIDKPDIWAMTIREPLGVVAAIVPWNSQLFLTAVKIAPALATGNTVVLKASEHASAPMLEFARVFEQAGFPAGVVNVVTGVGDPCGKALSSHPLVDRISFTGGLESARHIVHNSAENFAEVSLELGGKSPMIIFDDVDLENATNGVLLSIFSASGQSCVAGSRLLIQENIYDALLARIAERAGKIVIGDPLAESTQMGPLATVNQLELIERSVANAVENGATLVCGGRRPAHLGKGLYFEPTVVACPHQDFDVVRKEMFGPVVSVVKFRDEAEAIELANDTRFGLAAGVFTKDGARGLRMSKAVRAGIVWVNTYRMVSPMAPFGGYKHSGYGREAGLNAINDYTREKTVWINTSQKPIDDPFRMQ
ncbi:MAG: aldehyde dehydrogenase [Gammaproteobacteria bacterium]|jgi:acyl-CoA reductase-like NAD-dependent aldehyde dehydrogenase|nr:aldehyde dehydrogenase [Gammaproteobacteria bacterium]